MLTAELLGYTMSAAPEEIAGWRGRTLANDGDTTVIYTNIEDAVATPIGHLYRSTTLQGKTAAYRVTDNGADESVMWGQVKRPDSDTATTGEEAERKTTFSGTVRGVAGVFSCPGTTCSAPAPDMVAGSAAMVWTFTPTDPNGTIDVEDTAYLSFGWWLNAMGTDGEYEFDAFASPSAALLMSPNAGMVLYLRVARPTRVELQASTPW